MVRMWLRTAVVSLAVLGVALAACSSGTGTSAAQKSPSISKQDPVALAQTVNKLWEDHITWTRLYIISAATGLPDTQATAERLLQNQKDLGDAIKPFYGEAAGTQL